jgi:hypothetical protein
MKYQWDREEIPWNNRVGEEKDIDGIVLCIVKGGIK